MRACSCSRISPCGSSCSMRVRTSSNMVRANGNLPSTSGMSRCAANLKTSAFEACMCSPRGGPSRFKKLSKASFSIFPEPACHDVNTMLTCSILGSPSRTLAFVNATSSSTQTSEQCRGCLHPRLCKLHGMINITIQLGLHDACTVRCAATLKAVCLIVCRERACHHISAM